MPLFLYYKNFAVFILVYVQFTNAYYNVGYQCAIKKAV